MDNVSVTCSSDDQLSSCWFLTLNEICSEDPAENQQGEIFQITFSKVKEMKKVEGRPHGHTRSALRDMAVEAAC